MHHQLARGNQEYNRGRAQHPKQVPFVTALYRVPRHLRLRLRHHPRLLQIARVAIIGPSASIFSERKHFQWWYNWAARSRLEPMKKVASLLKRRFENIITYLTHPITNATSVRGFWYTSLGGERSGAAGMPAVS